jgi:hypothetical protein
VEVDARVVCGRRRGEDRPRGLLMKQQERRQGAFGIAGVWHDFHRSATRVVPAPRGFLEGQVDQPVEYRCPTPAGVIRPEQISANSCPRHIVGRRAGVIEFVTTGGGDE